MSEQSELSAAELAQVERFQSFYLRSQDPVMIDIERRVCGCNYGGNSWTTRNEADGLIALLHLGSDTDLLEIGAGAGWPGLYMTNKSGCNVTLVDLPANGLKIAEQRAEQDGTFNRVKTVIADAAHLPFSDASFDAISHSDLLCCLKHKASVLSSCRRVIRPEGKMAFTVIRVTPGLTGSDYRRSVENGPEFVESAQDYHKMINDTGWKINSCDDITAEFAASCGRQIEAFAAQEEALVELLGKDEYRQRVINWRTKLDTINDGLLRRNLFLITPNNLA